MRCTLWYHVCNSKNMKSIHGGVLLLVKLQARKLFLMSYSINWPNFTVWLSFLLEILGNMCIAIVCFPDCDVINFEIDLIFLINPSFCMTKKSRQKFKCLVKKICCGWKKLLRWNKKYNSSFLRILQGKSILKLNFSAYKKYKYGPLSRWYIKLTLFKGTLMQIWKSPYMV